MKSVVGIATYNEAENIGPLVRAILDLGLGLDVLVIDDNSPDGTGEIADRLAAEAGVVHVIHRPGKLGLGTATREAMRFAVDRSYDVLITMDADFSHDPAHLVEFHREIETADVVQGSRYIHGGGIVNWPVSRRFSSFLVNLFCKFVFRLPVHDYSGAYRAYRRWLLERLLAQKVISQGYSFQEEMLVRCAKEGARFGEVPIVFVDRALGATKADFAETVKSGLVLLRLGFWGL
ncbi:MAG: polyprenol monophosphomannose synthase [Planctomycetota bacterium]|jgi:dolichol-phosphate mannosyltransferase